MPHRPKRQRDASRHGSCDHDHAPHEVAFADEYERADDSQQQKDGRAGGQGATLSQQHRSRTDFHRRIGKTNERGESSGRHRAGEWDKVGPRRRGNESQAEQRTVRHLRRCRQFRDESVCHLQVSGSAPQLAEAGVVHCHVGRQ